MQNVPVLIVGGGPVGLALAGELGWRGVPCLLVEQGDGTIVTPKMNEVNVRTMEFCRRWGIADRVHNCPFPRDHARDAVFVTSLGGYELGRIPRPAVAGLKPEPWSPMRLQTCSQMWFDPILRDFALSSPASTCVIARRLESFQDTGDGVTAEIVDLESGKRERIEADYLVGCDGATSAIREKLGIGLKGQGVLGHPLHLFFRAPDLLKRVGKAEGTFFLAIDRDGLWANIRIVDPVNAMWRLMMLDSDGEQTPETIDKDALIRRAVGRPFDVEWVGCSIWTRRSLVAERYGKGRVFLAGDAVHQLSPTGALGMNTGIGDVVDLGWKLAAVAQGWGGAKLLSSYDSERQPIGVRAIDNTAGFHLSHGNFHSGFAAIEDDSEAGSCAARLCRTAVGAPGWGHVPYHRIAAWLPLRGVADHRAGRHAANAGRSGKFYRHHASRLARPACGTQRRQLDAGFLRIWLRVGAARRGRARWRRDCGGREEPRRAAADRDHR